MIKASSKRVLFCFAGVAISALAAVCFFWYVEAEEVTNTVSKKELIASNKSWIETNTAIPLTNHETVTLPVEKTNSHIEKNGDMVIETKNSDLINKIVSEKPDYKGMKAYRLRIFANKVSGYITNNKYKFPIEKTYSGMSHYKIEDGTRVIASSDKAIPVTHSGDQITAKTSLPIRFANESSEKTASLLLIDADKKAGSVSVDDAFKTKTNTITAYPKVFIYDYTAVKSTMLIFNSKESANIVEPIGIEYIMK